MQTTSSVRARLAVVLAAGALAAAAVAQPPKDTKPAKPAATPAAPHGQQPAGAKPEAKPGAEHGAAPAIPGMTEADMKACMEAGTPGKEHQMLAKGVGTWDGSVKMWMTAEMTEPMTSRCVTTISSIMDGRFTKCETKGDPTPGMPGPFLGMGIYGYDNAAKTFQANWIDNMGTTMMQGTGKASDDGKTLTWTYHFTCPINKKPTTMREVWTMNGEDSQTLEMFSLDPHTGKEFKCAEIHSTRRAGDEEHGRRGAIPATPIHAPSAKPAGSGK